MNSCEDYISRFKRAIFAIKRKYYLLVRKEEIRIINTSHGIKSGKCDKLFGTICDKTFVQCHRSKIGKKSSRKINTLARPPPHTSITWMHALFI